MNTCGDLMADKYHIRIRPSAGFEWHNFAECFQFRGLLAALAVRDVKYRTAAYEKSDGTYVDIGCFHPIQFSNTYIFYQSSRLGDAVIRGIGEQNICNYCSDSLTQISPRIRRWIHRELLPTANRESLLVLASPARTEPRLTMSLAYRTAARAQGLTSKPAAFVKVI
jgi:hypothetical protein